MQNKISVVFTLCLLLAPCAVSAATLDRVDFGNGEGVRISKSEPAFWRSGPLTAKLKVDPAKRNYVTVRLSGSDVSHDHLLLLVDGRTMGQMHLGEVDLLDYESCWPRDHAYEKSDPEHMGVSTFRTYLLPETLTQGKSELVFDIYATGHVWGYGKDFGQFMKDVKSDSRRLFAIFTHDTPFPQLRKVDLAREKVDPSADCYHKAVPEVDLAKIRAEVDKSLKGLMKTAELARHVGEAGFLAEGYWTEGTVAYKNPAAVEAIVAVMDDVARKYAADETPKKSSVIESGSWNGLGPIADGLWRLGAEGLGARLDEDIAGLGKRRTVWADALAASCNQLFTQRRFFANQGQIVDTNCHRVNRALKLCDPSRGPSLAVTTEHLKEAMGLKPCPNGYVALTPKGLSKEDGFVGIYGESTIWAACDAYAVTVERATGRGDAELLKQLEKAVLARSYFRYPGVRRDGSRVMRLENVISWRNDHFPGMPDYLTNGSCLLRPLMLSHSKAMLGILKDAWDDGWFQRFAAGQGEKQMSQMDKMFFLRDYPAFEKALARAAERKIALPHLPMRGKNFVWCDSENAVVALKYGEEILYVNAYYRARGSINNLARLHFVRPDSEFAATVWCDEVFEQAKKKGKDGAETDELDFKIVHNYFQYGWQGKCYEGFRAPHPDGRDPFAWPPRNARDGMKEPVATRGGRADFYHVSWGPYEVVVNDDPAAKPRAYKLPAGGTYVNVATGKRLNGGATVSVPAHDGLAFRKVK